MLIPKKHRQVLKRVGRPHLFWYRISDWAFGERYKLLNGVTVLLFEDEIITLRRGANVLWRKEDDYGK